MNLLSSIISNAMDLAGAARLEFDLGGATLYAMNVVADMELELSHSARGRQLSKNVGTFTARTGTLPALPAFIRYRAGASEKWDFIEIVSDIEDLTQAENENRRAIIFLGTGSPYTYELSFVPEAGFNQVELWGAAPAAEPTALNQPTSLPSAYTHLAAVRCALLLLDDVFLKPNAANLTAFVESRRGSLFRRQRDLEHRWTVYRSNADLTLSDTVARAYDPFAKEEFGSVFERN